MAQLGSLKTYNASRVLSVLAGRGRASRPELAEATGLSRATIGFLVDYLADRGLVRESGLGTSTGGRPPVLVEFNPEAAYALGAGMYELRWTVVLADLHGRILDRETVEMDGTEPSDAVRAISIGVDRMRERTNPRHLLPGIGVGSPGLVEWETGVVRSAVDMGWFDVPLGKMVETATGLRAFVVNRGKLGALAEFWHAGRSPQELIHVTIGTGVAAGIIHKGELYTGPSSSAGELGHTTILPDGPLCACGNRGCLQELVSESALVARAREALRDNGNTGGLLAARAGSHPEQLSAQDVLDAAHDGDEIALSVLREAAAYLGIAIANMINLLNPQRIVLGGPIGSASSMFCGLVREQVRKRAMAYPFSKVSIDQTSLGFDAGAVGASVLILKQAPALLLERPGGMLAGITMTDQSYDGS